MSTLLGYDTSAPPARSIGSGTGYHQSSSWRALLHAPLDWLERRWRRQSLSDLIDNPRTLNDIGLTRDDVLREINRPFWR
jgi:uncharacterized protein YjiS (DUF1127 family)